jgi:hypothetical protein
LPAPFGYEISIERMAEIIARAGLAAQTGTGELPSGFDVTQTNVFADLITRDRAELEALFEKYFPAIGVTLDQQRAIDLLALQPGSIPGPGQELLDREFVLGQDPAGLARLITDLVNALGNFTAATTTIPEGFSIPIGTQPIQSGFYGATGGFGPAPGATPAPGYGFPPTLPSDLAQFENFFLPGNLLPPPPTFGFDANTFFELLEAQTAAQAQAQLEQQGEVEGTVSLEALLAEERVLLHASMLDEQVQNTAVATDTQIALMESMLAKQREALEGLTGDPELAADADAVQESITILEGLIADARQAQADAAEALLLQETEAHLDAEEAKRDEIRATTQAAETSGDERLRQEESQLRRSVTAAEQAARGQVAAVEDRYQEEGAVSAEFRMEELEAGAEHEGEKAELLVESRADQLGLQSTWWGDYLNLQAKGINEDLRMMQQWLQNRITLYNQAQFTLPGEGTNQFDNGGDDSGGSGSQPTLQQLRIVGEDLAERLGMNVNLVVSEMLDMNYQELHSFVTELQELADARGLRTGGRFAANELIKVGEDGIEYLRFGDPGEVIPAGSLMEFSPANSGGMGAITTIDQSLHMGGINIPDPRGLSPAWRAMIENIAANTAIKAWSGLPR